MNKPLIEFNPKLPKLSKNESAVLKLLIEAGRLIVPLYLEQENQKKVSKEEIEKQAKKNPDVLSPYTVVEKVRRQLIVTSYHIKYAKFLKPIAEKLEEAAKLSENKEFGKVLKIQANALLDGSYEEVMAAKMKMKQYIIDISIGPLNHLDNQIFFSKAAYHAWIGVLDMEGTKRLNNYKSIVLCASRQALVPQERVDNLDRVKAKTIDEVLLSGFVARTKFVGLNLPMDVNLVEKYGSEITIFNQVNNVRLKEQIVPIFKKIFSSTFQEEFSLEDLRRGSLRYVALHELAHNYLNYKNAAKNLQDLFPSIYELTATLLGMRIAGSLHLKDVITNKQLESMIVTFISRSFDLIEKSKQDKYMINYALGGAIFINYMLASGALKQLKGMTIPNFMKIFVSMHELSYIMEHLLSSGTRKDAEALVERYGRFNKTFK